MLRDLHLPLGRGMYGSALERGQLLSHRRLPERYERSPTIRWPTASCEAANMRSMAAAPMFADQKPLGVLGVFSSDPHAFDEQQLTLLARPGRSRRRGHRQPPPAASPARIRAAAAQQAAELSVTLSRTARSTKSRAASSTCRRRRGAAGSRRHGQRPAGFRRRAPDADQRGENVLRPIVTARHTEPALRAWLRSPAIPAGRRHQRPRGTAGRGCLDLRLPLGCALATRPGRRLGQTGSSLVRSSSRR